MISCPVVLYCIVSYRIVSCRVVSCRVVSYRVVLWCVVLYCVVLYFIIVLFVLCASSRVVLYNCIVCVGLCRIVMPIAAPPVTFFTFQVITRLAGMEEVYIDTTLLDDPAADPANLTQYF